MSSLQSRWDTITDSEDERVYPMKRAAPMKKATHKGNAKRIKTTSAKAYPLKLVGRGGGMMSRTRIAMRRGVRWRAWRGVGNDGGGGGRR